MNSTKQKRLNAVRRAARVRARLHGTGEKPRLTIKRSLKHIYAQLIDDNAGKTLASASDLTVKAEGKPMDVAAAVGAALGAAAVKAGIKEAVVDRGPYRFHGRIKALVDAAHKAGVVCTGENE